MRMAAIAQNVALVLTAIVLSTVPVAAQEPGDATRGAVYAERTCARCHGIGPGEKFSPVPGLAPFKLIANTPGMTATALSVFLRTPHKDMPNFMIEASDRADVIAYIMALRDAPPAR